MNILLINGILGSIELVPTVLILLGIIVFFFLFRKYTFWRFKKRFCCSSTETFLLDVSLPAENYGKGASKASLYDWGAYRLSLFFSLRKQIVFQKGIWFSESICLPFTITLGIFGRPYLSLDMDVEYNVMSADFDGNGIHIEVIGEDFYSIVEKTFPLSFKKTEDKRPYSGHIEFISDYRESFPEIEFRDRVRFILNSKGEITIEKVNSKK